MRVVGIDLSLTSTGYAENDGSTTTFKSSGQRADTFTDRRRRLNGLALAIVERTFTVSQRVPDMVLVEGPSYASVGTGTWDRAGLWWLVYDRLATVGTRLVVVPPSSRCKYVTGRGNASKAAVVDGVARRFGGLWGELTSDDVADACALVAMGCHALGEPLATLPAAHVAALTGVDWVQGCVGSDEIAGAK